MPNRKIETFTVKTTQRNQLVEVTGRVEELIARHGVRNGLVIVFVPHTTSCVTKLPSEFSRPKPAIVAIYQADDWIP